jgi:dihydropyrimidinase
MQSILIRQGNIVTAEGDLRGDILIMQGNIAAVGEGIEKPDPATRVIDASGAYVLPGGVDPHVHMELPSPAGISSDDFESGSRAALSGGTTAIIDFVTPARGQSLLSALQERKEAACASVCDFGLHMSITDWNERTSREMRHCLDEEGISSFKVYMAYKETIGLEDRQILSVMDAAAKQGALVAVHCENGDAIAYLQRKLITEGNGEARYHPLSRPPEVEGEAARRAILLARVTGCRLYLVHVSTRDALEEIARAREAGQAVMAETCPHYLLLDEEVYTHPGPAGAAYVMSPPLRSAAHRKALWEGLRAGALQTVATDHCPFNLKGQKDIGLTDFTRIPNGIAGIEDRLSLLFTYGVLEGRISIRQFVNLTATAPAKIFGLYPRKGTIAAGSDADLVIWDPKAEGVISAQTHRQRCDTNVYEGFRIQGRPHIVIQRGRLAYEDGQVVLERGAGKYLARGRGGS